MRIFAFMLAKSLRTALVITLAMSVVLCVLFCFVAEKGYVFDDEYTTAFAELERESAYKEISEKAAEFQNESNKLSNDINEYINSCQKYGEPPVVLPDGLAGKAVRSTQKGIDGSTADKSKMYAFMLTELKDGSESEQLINEKLSGYSRNARRGVTDEYSLALSGVLTQDYERVLERQKETDKLYDTRAANVYVNFLAEDKLFYALTFLLFFAAFSSERQSRRLKAFAITKSGAGSFILCKQLTSAVVCLLCVTLYHLCLFLLMCAFGGGDCIDMPLQYLEGYELSSFDMSFGGFCALMLILRLLSAALLCQTVLLLSFLSRKTIIAGIVCLAPPALFMGLITSESEKAHFISCNMNYFFGGEGYMKIFGTPFPAVWLYVFAVVFLTAVINITIYAQSLRREF